MSRTGHEGADDNASPGGSAKPSHSQPDSRLSDRVGLRSANFGVMLEWVSVSRPLQTSSSCLSSEMVLQRTHTRVFKTSLSLEFPEGCT